MSEVSDLTKKLQDTKDQIARLDSALASRRVREIDKINRMSLIKREERLEQLIAGSVSEKNVQEKSNYMAPALSLVLNIAFTGIRRLAKIVAHLGRKDHV